MKIYTNKNGLDTKLWGPIIWNFLHIISLNFPLKPTKKEKKHFFYIIKSLKYTLPCKKCRKNIEKNLKKVEYKKKEHYKNRKKFILLIYNLHNEVNQKIGKETKTMEETVVKYNEIYRVKN